MKIVIPSRFASTRLPGKPLLEIAGKPMIRHVWERACAAFGRPEEVFVATDDARIAETVEGFGGQAVMTRGDHVSGTDRIAEVSVFKGWGDDEIVINVQGDEPMIPPALIRLVGEGLARQPLAAIATACHPIGDEATLHDPNAVKVVRDSSGFAAYFSRAPIPYRRDAGAAGHDSTPYLRHVGLYAYRVATLKALSALPPAPAEKMESLEQLRALWHGYRILVECAGEAPPAGVDTAEDLERVRSALKARAVHDY